MPESEPINDTDFRIAVGVLLVAAALLIALVGDA